MYKGGQYPGQQAVFLQANLLTILISSTETIKAACGTVMLGTKLCSEVYLTPYQSRHMLDISGMPTLRTPLCCRGGVVC